MEGVVTKIEAKTDKDYGDSRYVIGSTVTVLHIVIGQKEEAVRVSSTVFMPPNSVLPLIGDAVVAGIFVEPQPEALPESGDLEFVELPDDTD